MPARSPNPRVARRPSARSRQRRSPPSWVYVVDRGTVLDAPLEVVWDFMKNDEEFHPQAHAATLRNLEVERLSELTHLIRCEMRVAGRWRTIVSRLTEIRPAVRIDEEIEGPFAGSKKVFLYSPRGDKTSLEVHCYMRSSEHSPGEIRRSVLRELATNHAEDVPYLRLFARKRRADRDAPT